LAVISANSRALFEPSVQQGRSAPTTARFADILRMIAELRPPPNT
jgi:hypothetical protein